MITRDSKNILVAKDSLFFRNRLSSILASAGHRIRLVEDGNAAMAAIETDVQGIDLLIMNFLLPDTDAFRVLKWMGDNGYDQKFPVFVVTEEGESSHIISSLFRYGASGVISKDFTPERIVFHINRAIFPEKASVSQKSVRIPVSVPVDFSAEGLRKETGIFLNISKSGAFLHTGAPLSQGAELDLRFSLPDIKDPFDTRGSVVWKANAAESDPLFGGYGIRFTSVTPAEQSALDAYIDSESRKLLVSL